LSETDITSDVILLTPAPWAIELALETPSGSVIGVGPGATYHVGNNVAFWHVTLPLPLGSGTAHAGQWHAILKVDEHLFKKYLSSLGRERDVLLKEAQPESREVVSARAHGIPYSLSARSWSNLRMRARLSQNSHAPGAELTIRTILTEYDVPVERRATVKAELDRPDGTHVTLSLAEVEPGVFETSITAKLSGIYHVRVLATGRTFRDVPFTREHLLTGAVWQGGDAPPPSVRTDPGREDERWCKLVACLLHTKGVPELLEKHGIDHRGLASCLKSYCNDPARSNGDGLPGREPKQRIRDLLDEPAVRRALFEALRREMEEGKRDD
jgi:hypothetical protein